MNKEELIEKIKKLLALATDNSTTEHEKALAMKKAQDIMAQHSIEEYDLNTVNVQDLIVREVIKLNLTDHMPTVLNAPMFLGKVLSPICNNFGCYTYHVGIAGAIGEYWIMGFKTNIEIAKYACDVLINQGIQDFKVGFKIHRSIGYGINFWKGFHEGLVARFSKVSNEKALVLYDKVKEAWEKSVTFVTMHSAVSTLASGNKDGFKSATDAKLNPAVSTSHGKLLK